MAALWHHFGVIASPTWCHDYYYCDARASALVHDGVSDGRAPALLG
jgi:hypothetical protein